MKVGRGAGIHGTVQRKQTGSSHLHLDHCSPRSTSCSLVPLREIPLLTAYTCQTAKHSGLDFQDTGVTGQVQRDEMITTRKARRNSESHEAGIYTDVLYSIVQRWEEKGWWATGEWLVAGVCTKAGSLWWAPPRQWWEREKAKQKHMRPRWVL